ncbi:hypothetical protein NC651_010407 [Populus alba x Populus x berolinensis]|nr:hypothetical protein NC651_010407 [Populus alba x Populus x berolinensis]
MEHLGDLNSLLSCCRNHELDLSKGVLAPSELRHSLKETNFYIAKGFLGWEGYSFLNRAIRRPSWVLCCSLGE